MIVISSLVVSGLPSLGASRSLMFACRLRAYCLRDDSLALASRILYAAASTQAQTPTRNLCNSRSEF